MLKVVIDATPITPKPSGIGIYVANLIANLAKLQQQEQFELGISYQPSLKNWLGGNLQFPDLLSNYSNCDLLPLPVRVSNWLLNNCPQVFPLFIEKANNYPNLVHGTDFSVYPYQKSLKAMTIHDLTFLKYPQYINRVVANYAQRVKDCLTWTDLIITVSESSKKDIIEYLEFPEERIFVTPLASRYHPNYLSSESIKKLKESCKYDFDRPYILFVGTIEPRKNISTLIKAFNYLKQKYNSDLNLVLIGQKGWKYEPIFKEINNSPWRKSIYHLNYLSDDLLALFYLLAELFVYPSHYEGFGLPVLEAMNLGTPVITSNTSSLPEITGDAGILINPNNAIEIAEEIWRVIDNNYLRQDLTNKGRQRAKNFSWEKTAKETLKAYQSV